MPIAAGTRLGPYEIVTLLGAGGMGEVYRAKDSRLHRHVAIKVLPSGFAGDPTRMARFEREAHLLAALSHPNIAAVHGLEESASVPALVMELVEGPTLAERIAAGPIPLDEALANARQIGAALEAAHEKGIVHRDLKPANIKITPEGQVKVLDFGLAKAFDAGDATVPGELTNSPTLTLEATRAGVILGTAGYMSPEQARGKPTDKRTDIWAFGVILYEMLTGHMMFDGETVSDTLAAVLRAEIDWKELPAGTPTAVRRLLERCLDRDPKRRLRDIGDAWFEIDSSPAASVSAAAPRPASRWLWAALAAAGVAGLAGFAWGMLRRPPTVAQPVVRWSYVHDKNVCCLALSRDGARMGMASVSGSIFGLDVRSMDRLDARPMAGTKGALSPAFSPDGQWIAYLNAPNTMSTAMKLTKIPVGGGTPITLCELTLDSPFLGIAWTADDSIVLGGKALTRVSAAGGTPESLTASGPLKNVTRYITPEALPGGRELLLSIAADQQPQVAIFDLKTHALRVLPASGVSPHYVAPGYLVYYRNGSLFASPFDIGRRAITGQEAPVLDGVASLPDRAGGDYAVSESGVLVYIPGESAQGNRTILQFTDRKGASQPLTDPIFWGAGRLSPDGKRIANGIKTDKGQDIWVYDVERRTPTRLTFDESSLHPIWSPDGRSIAYQSDFQSKHGIYRVAADGSGKPELLVSAEFTAVPNSWSWDGKTIIYTQVGADKKRHLWTLPIGGRPSQLGETAFNEIEGEISPDGKWIAYESDEAGPWEVYVQSFPAGGGKTRISTHGAIYPRWAPNGKELFYWENSGDAQAFVVPIQTAPAFRAGIPEPLFKFRPGTTWDVAPDGKHFLTEVAETKAAHETILGVVNWFEELRHRMPRTK